MLNLKTKDTYQYFDEHGMCLVKGDPLSWRDSIGRTVLAGIAYGFTPELVKGLEDCIYVRSDGKFGLWRHPVHGVGKDISRDHWSYYIMYKYLTSTRQGFLAFTWSVTDLPGLNMWRFALAGSKAHEWLYYAVQIPGAVLGVIYNKIISFIGGINTVAECHQYGWYTPKLSKWQRFWRKLLLPTYALHNKAWQVYLLPNCGSKAKLQKLLLKRLPRYSSNYLVRLLLGGTVSPKLVNSYVHMTSYRWGVFLNDTNDRTTYIITDPALLAANALEVDILLKVYGGKKGFKS